MRERCNSINCEAYKNYGGRGIKICPQWNKFENFVSDIGNKPTINHSLDRIDNNKDYSKDNCRWVLRSEQSRNRRSNRFYEYNNEKLCLLDLAMKYKIKRETLTKRLNTGMSIIQAIETPIGIKSNQYIKKRNNII
ncbi:MAG: hypothetical protein ACRCSG_08665 [Cellulosilyticaceae bacterium]